MGSKKGLLCFRQSTSPESFLSGDGNWTGSAKGESGKINPNFIFAYPPDWIETPMPSEWTWQKDIWKFPSVEAVYQDSLTKTYATLNEYVSDITNATYSMYTDEKGKARIMHDPKVVVAMDKIGGYHFENYLTEPLSLHFPDRDHISLPAWNYDLCKRINVGVGQCLTFEYLENNHGMRISKHKWFSSQNAVEGYAHMIARDITFFKGVDPSDISELEITDK